MTQDLSELLNLNKKLISQNYKLINQNYEIIELLKIIAGESDETEEENVPANITFDSKPQLGVVYFIEDESVFKLTIKNNETIIDNLNGSAKPNDFALQEMIANESIKRNIKIPNATVILSKSQSLDLPNSLKICIENGAENVFIPFSSLTQLIAAPDEIMTLIKLDFYKTEEELTEKVLKQVIE